MTETAISDNGLRRFATAVNNLLIIVVFLERVNELSTTTTPTSHTVQCFPVYYFVSLNVCNLVQVKISEPKLGVVVKALT